MAKTIEDVTTKHPLIYHYTTGAGLIGILKSQQLWATHISYLNDYEEHTWYFDNRLPKLLSTTLSQALNEIKKTQFGTDLIEEQGGFDKCLKELREQLIAAVRDTQMEFNQPYVVSFCGTPEGNIADNGLLSQWRGYGSDGGYSIVFDTAALFDLLENNEIKNFNHQYGYLGDVQYYDNESNPIDELPETSENEALVQDAIQRFIFNPAEDTLAPLYEPLTSLSCNSKSEGFREESEVRLVTLPAHPSLLEASRKAGDNRPNKLAEFFNRDGLIVPYLPIFKQAEGHEAIRLPIKKIIIGPHPDRLKRKQSIQFFLKQHGLDVDVVVSNISFTGR